MVRASERILVIGDRDRQVESALAQTFPTAEIRSSGGVFDGIAELTAGDFTTVMLAAEPVERRPDAAVKTLRNLTGEGRLLIFGPAGLEPLSRKMLEFGCDDYIVTRLRPPNFSRCSAPLHCAW